MFWPHRALMLQKGRETERQKQKERERESHTLGTQQNKALHELRLGGEAVNALFKAAADDVQEPSLQASVGHEPVTLPEKAKVFAESRLDFLQLGLADAVWGQKMVEMDVEFWRDDVYQMAKSVANDFHKLGERSSVELTAVERVIKTVDFCVDLAPLCKQFIKMLFEIGGTAVDWQCQGQTALKLCLESLRLCEQVKNVFLKVRGNYVDVATETKAHCF